MPSRVIILHDNDGPHVAVVCQTLLRQLQWEVLEYPPQNPDLLPCDYHIGQLKKKTLKRRDEAHFWLNGYVNKQNRRIWSEANPQVYVETPLHPEKLTVWCALWAGGILLQKR
ncbi:hypothetical protein TNCV_886401 [Trichonephila clavipes]|nr:hypothetical protein TNCV_886401 [Trichonephila clavipes]